MDKIDRSDAEWRATLDPDQYKVLRHEGTERPFSNSLNDEKRKGSTCVPAVASHCLLRT